MVQLQDGERESLKTKCQNAQTGADKNMNHSKILLADKVSSVQLQSDSTSTCQGGIRNPS